MTPLELAEHCASGRPPPPWLEYSEAITVLAKEVLRLSGIAQSVERRAVNADVAGSSPAPGAKELSVCPECGCANRLNGNLIHASTCSLRSMSDEEIRRELGGGR